MKVRISAVVCTHNRATCLRTALHSLVNQSLAPQSYEIIVVDNASRDQTKEVVEEFSQVPNLRYVPEPTLGLSRARNTGWRNAQGAYVAFLDDDAVACSDWLAMILHVYDSFQPSPGAVGGKVEAIWEAPQPTWLSDKMLAYLALADWSDEPTIITGDQQLPGCNIAFPRQLVEKAGGFREDLGREGNRLGQGEETQMRLLLESWGYPSVYHPEISVLHLVQSSRLNKGWFRRILYWTGVSQAVIAMQDGRRSTCAKVRLSTRWVAWALPRAFLSIVTVDPAARFRRQCQAIRSLGYVVGLWRSGAEVYSAR